MRRRRTLRSKVWSALTRNPEKPDLPLGRERSKEKLEDYVEVPSDVVPFEQRPWTRPTRERRVKYFPIRAGSESDL